MKSLPENLASLFDVPVLTKADARRQRYYSLTRPYSISDKELEMLRRAHEQLGKIPHVFVRISDKELELWRKREN